MIYKEIDAHMYIKVYFRGYARFHNTLFAGNINNWPLQCLGVTNFKIARWPLISQIRNHKSTILNFSLNPTNQVFESMLFIDSNSDPSIFPNNFLYNFKSIIIFFIDPLFFLAAALLTLYCHNNEHLYLMRSKVFLCFLNESIRLISFIFY